MAERDTVVVKEGGGGTTLLAMVIVLIVVVAAVWFFLAGPGASTKSGDGSNDINVTLDLPSVAPAAS